MSSRVVVFHYHLFKNAGTSLDRILQDNFGSRWLTQEFSMASQNNTNDVAEWIVSTPSGIAYSTHTAMGPLPQIDRVTFIPIMLLRDPVERIISAYHFERKQEAETWGTQLAREHDFEGYVQARLGSQHDRQCRNFYSHRLASLSPIVGSELERAQRGLSLLHSAGIVGRVEDFDTALARLAARLQPHFPDFVWRSTKANVSDRQNEAHISPNVAKMLRRANQHDYRLLENLEQLSRA